MTTTTTYVVTVGNIFDAQSPEDAVLQMAAWLSEYAAVAGYRVTREDGSNVGFYDAERMEAPE